MTPTKFLDYHVSVEQDLTHVNGMVTSYFVVRHSFVLARVLVFVKALIQDLSQGLEIFVVTIDELFGFSGGW